MDTPRRRSPRLFERYGDQQGNLSSTSTSKAATTACMDVFLFEVTRSNNRDPKMSKTSTVLRDIPVDSTLAKLKKVVRAQESTSVVYVPVNGFYWIRKGSKQMVQLQSEADLEYCKAEYKDSKKSILSSIRIACATVDYSGLC